jgi:UDP-glucose 4-epimerase
MKRIIIIGSKGFIGSNALQYFRKQGLFTIGCDIVKDNDDINYVQVDSTNADYQDIFKKNEIDVCVNCSGAASVPFSIQDPQKDYLLNTVNVFKILDAIRIHRPQCKFINLSSAAIYGNPKRLPIEETFIYQPVSPYGSHKMQAEILCKEFNDYFNLKTCSLRIFSAYGEGLKKQLIWDLWNKIQNATDTLTLWGTGKESRDFIHVDDIVQIIDLIIHNGSFNAAIYNVANGQEVTISEVVNSFCKLNNWSGKVIFNMQSRVGDPLNWCADIKKIKNLGYIQKIDLTMGLKKIIEWQKEKK